MNIKSIHYVSWSKLRENISEKFSMFFEFIGISQMMLLFVVMLGFVFGLSVVNFGLTAPLVVILIIVAIVVLFMSLEGDESDVRSTLKVTLLVYLFAFAFIIPKFSNDTEAKNIFTTISQETNKKGNTKTVVRCYDKDTNELIDVKTYLVSDISAGNVKKLYANKTMLSKKIEYIPFVYYDFHYEFK